MAAPPSEDYKEGCEPNDFCCIGVNLFCFQGVGFSLGVGKGVVKEGCRDRSHKSVWNGNLCDRPSSNPDSATS